MDKIKLVVIDNSNVGKTAIIYQYIYHNYYKEHPITIGSERSIKKITIDEKTINLEIWDTAGVEQSRSLTKLYMIKLKIALIVYDITDKKTFEDLNYHIQTVKEINK